MNPRSRALRRTKSNLCSGGLCDDPAILRRQITNDKARAMIKPPETVRVTRSRVACDGASDIPGGAARGHPRIYMEIDEKGYVDCGYCDRRFVLIGGPADISPDPGSDGGAHARGKSYIGRMPQTP